MIEKQQITTTAIVPSDHIEIIVVEEFLRRMNIKRTTFFKWKSTGKLKRGEHFTQCGGVIRIFWSINLLRDLDDKVAIPKESLCKGISPHAVITKRKQSSINLNY